MSSQYQQSSGCYTCRVCGKKTRETGHEESSCRLCAFCYEESLLENHHNDFDGCDPYDPACPLCNHHRETQIEALCTEYGVQAPKRVSLPETKPIRTSNGELSLEVFEGYSTETQLAFFSSNDLNRMVKSLQMITKIEKGGQAHVYFQIRVKGYPDMTQDFSILETAISIYNGIY